MTELINLFGKLSEFFETNLIWEQVQELYEKATEVKGKTNRNTKTPNEKQNQNPGSSESEDDEPLAVLITNCGNEVTSLPLVRRALQNPQVHSTLLELCTTIRSLRESSASYDNTYDCWDQVVKVMPRDSYLAFIYTLAGLLSLDPTSMVYTKLSLAAVNTYFLSLTIPGAKGFHIFEEEVITHCLQVFTLVENIESQPPVNGSAWQQLVEKWVRFVTFCDDLKLLLRYVHFGDYKSTRDAMMKKLVDIQYLNHERGYANMYAANLHTTCFDVFEEMINAHNGEPEETLMKLMNMTVFLHTYAPKPKSNVASALVAGRDCEHISDWFIKCIAKYPRLLVKVLNFYIECIVTNPIKTWKTEQTQRALEYAAKYDAALFTKCNESCVEFLCDAVYAEEAMIRSRAIDLMLRMLQLESSVDWQMFRHEVSDIPREVHLIKELIDSLQDNNNNIKLKAVQALHATFTKGSPNAMKILTEGVRYAQLSDTNVVLPVEPRVRKNEIRYEKPVALVPQYTFEGHGLIELSFMHLPQYIYKYIFQSSLSYIRRAGIMFMENIVKLNPLVIFNTNFVVETTRLVDEPTALVRKQTLLTVDAILTCYPNCFPVIWVWCKIIAPMLHDTDPKNIELAMDCFRSRVLLNIRGIDQSNKAEHFMPWVIIRTMLSTQSRLYLQTCFHLALQQRMLNTQILSTIESHLLTSNSTEAWIVLNFISGKIKSKEPDALIHMFTSLHSWNKEQNMLIALEVLANCIHDFSHTALNHAFNHIVTGIREGKILPVLIGKAFDFLILIDNRSQTQESKQKAESSTEMSSWSRDKAWIIELHDLLEYNILTGIADFPENRSTFMSYLYSYSEVNLQTRLRPHRTIISFIHKYMSECIKLPELELDSDNERLFNSMILISGRFSLRDACVANTTCTLYGGILKKIDRPPIVNTIIVSITDVCKKHTQIVERILEHVMQKLSSPFAMNRIETFKCFEKLVLQDQLKLRGSLLLALLATILDDSQELATRACEFFSEFLSKKNSTLFQKCLIECPFVLNEYKNFDGLDSFSENAITSPLKGESKRKSRQLLYNHMMLEVDEINLILYFWQLKLIAEKSLHDPLIHTPEGIALVKDVIFILKRVCQLTKEVKQTAENKDNSESKNDESVTEIDDNAAKETEKVSDTEVIATGTTAARGLGRGRGRRREVTTMADALNLLEKSITFIPTIYNNIHQSDTTIEKCFDELCKALANRFASLIDYAQPAEFWNKYRKSKVTENMLQMSNIKNAKRRKLNETSTEVKTSENEETETEEESDFLSDEDLPLIKRISPIISCTELPMAYLFNPNI